MSDEKEMLFNEFFNNLLNYMNKEGWAGACHATTAMMYAFGLKIGLNPIACIGEVEKKGDKPFDHSWLTIDDKIYDLAISLPLPDGFHMATGPVYASIDKKTNKEVDIKYGIKFLGLGPQAMFAYQNNLYSYISKCPSPKIINVIIDLAKRSKIFITRKWLENNLSNVNFTLVDTTQR